MCLVGLEAARVCVLRCRLSVGLGMVRMLVLCVVLASAWRFAVDPPPPHSLSSQNCTCAKH